MTRTPLIALAAILCAAAAQAEDAPLSSEEAAALYFAPPAEESLPAAVDPASLDGAVALAIGLGKVETALEGCRVLRREMTALIGDDYGSYSVNPGWLRRYQDCVVTRSGEARGLGRAVQARRTELLEREAVRGADLMARLAARQSAVQLAVRKELRMQKAFVAYYNSGELPDALASEDVSGL